MARRPSLIKLKNKKQKKSKTEQFLVNYKAFGEEPTFTDKELTRGELSRYYNWYNYMSDAKEGKSYLLEYLKNTNRRAEAKEIRSISDRLVPSTICWIARMRSLGARFPQESLDYFENTIKIAISEDQRRASEGQSDQAGGANNDIKKASQKPSVYDKVRAKATAEICLIEEEIDKFLHDWKTDLSMYSWMEKHDVTPQSAKMMYEYYNPQLLEIEESFGSEGRVGYDGYTKTQHKKLYGLMVALVEDIELFIQNKNKVRKTTTHKPISTEKKLKNFKYKEFDNNLKVQSVAPSRIIGASEIWLYDTKNRKLTVLRALDQMGFNVNGMSITNYDEKTSMTKGIRVNKVEETVKEVLNSNKTNLRKYIDEITTTRQDAKHRVNADTLLLKIY